MMVRDFQSVIGNEAKEQIVEKEGRLPDLLIACLGGGSNALGLFYPFLDDLDVSMIAVEAGGKGINTNRTAASINKGSIGVLHGMKSYMLQDKDGQIEESHSISSGLDYVSLGPEHSFLFEEKRVAYEVINDDECLKAFQLCCKLEGIIPALEPAHALAHLIKIAPKRKKDEICIMNMCGRGDKDIFTVAKHLGIKL